MQCAENRLANPGGVAASAAHHPPPTTVRRRFAPCPDDTTGPHSPRQPPDHTGGGNATASAATNRTVRRAAQQADVWTTPRPIDRPATSGVLAARQSPLLRLLPTTQPDHTAPGSPPITQAGMPQPAPPPTARCAGDRRCGSTRPPSSSRPGSRPRTSCTTNSSKPNGSMYEGSPALNRSGSPNTHRNSFGLRQRPRGTRAAAEAVEAPASAACRAGMSGVRARGVGVLVKLSRRSGEAFHKYLGGK